MKPVTFVIAGCGSRGMQTYAPMENQFNGRMKIVGAADMLPDKLEKMRITYNLDPAMCFNSAEEMFAKDKMADVAIISTMDAQHHAHAMAALQKGYHLLLEKPVATNIADCEDIARLANEKNLNVVVCHVLRYTVFYQQIKQIIDSGELGKIMNINAFEDVAYWHMAHSFVRGNWRNKEETSPMILQKCCHDMDILLWLTGKHCLRVSSFGKLSYFTKDNMPENAPKRCIEGCPEKDCPYNAVNFYMGKLDSGKTDWPLDVLTTDVNRDNIIEALRNGPYGRCVYQCDNDVVDHQVVNLQLEDDIFVNFTMSAFNQGGRKITIMGTKAMLYGDMEKKTIRIEPFGKPERIIDVSKLTEDFSGHGGGDTRMMDDLLHLVSGEEFDASTLTSVDRSIESHKVALAAEESRLNNGSIVNIK